MNTITWLHLSDLHFRADELHAWDADIVLRELLKDVRARLDEGLRPDLILVSGDIAFSGQPAEYELARAFFDELLDATDVPRERLLLVPGNHDVDRDLVSFPAEATAEKLTDRDSTNRVLGHRKNRQLMFERFQGYAAFVNDYLEHLHFDSDNYFYVQALGLAGLQVAFLGLNSAWVAASDEDRANGLLIGDWQAREALRKAEDADLRIALFHHPFGWLRDFDRDDCEPLLSAGCRFILHGHLHRTGLTLHQTPDARTMMIAAGASYEKRTSDNRYNLVQLDLEAQQGTVILRAWSDRRGGFWAKDSGTYRDVEGQVAFPLSLPAEVTRKGKRRPAPVPAVPGEEVSRLEAAYLRKVQLACNVLPLAVIDPRAVERTRQRTMDLLSVYVALDTETPVAEEGEEGQDKARARALPEAGRPDRETRRLTALEAAAGERQMVLLGDPGSGKSTFANYLALCLAGARLEGLGEVPAVPGEGWLVHLEPAWSHGPLLPLRVTLRHFAASDWCDGTAAGLWAFIAGRLAAEGLGDFAPYLRQRLLDGGVLVMFDGLDEVADPAARTAVRDAVADLASTFGHPGNRILVTCRVYAYQDGRWQLDPFARHTLAAFSQPKIDAFVDCWYREVCRLGWKTESEAEDLTRRLQGATRRPDLAPLAQSPLQLTMMASLHFSWGRLPDDRVELYQEMVRLLLVRWQEARLGQEVGVTRVVGVPDLESALERVAFQAHQAGEGREGMADVQEAVLLDVLKDVLEGSWDRARELLVYVQQRAGLLLEREPGVYTFPHRSYQEYLAGSYLAVQPDFPDRAAALVGENYAQWREVVLWAVGVMARLKRMTHVAVDVAAALCPQHPPGEAVSEQEWRAAHLAGEALLEIGLKEVEARERHVQVLERVRGWLAALLERGALPPAERARAGRALGQLGDPRFRPDAWFLSARFRSRPEPLLGFVEIPEGPFLMGSEKARDPGADIYEFPQHEVSLPSYYIARYPVTVAQFRAFVDEGGFRPGNPNCLRDPDNHPVRYVNWHEARAYCGWLGDRLREWPGLPGELAVCLRDEGWTVRLPTEAEWEKAARGPLHSDGKGDMEGAGRIYPWGDEFDPSRCNTWEGRIGTTSAVGMYPSGASPYGVLDLSGNVWEWTRSLWGRNLSKPKFKYPYRADDGREDESAGDDVARVLRGGAFSSSVRLVRCAYRFRHGPDVWYLRGGFRVVVAPG
jgi:formylglycine-generating enzyme required for sulfatase activity